MPPSVCHACISVYPRPRGGTSLRRAEAGWRGGLSPPTRGNRGNQRMSISVAGSIPAHAGEPFGRGTSPPTARVYPRPRGGTRRRPHRGPPSRGLSPPTRGNPPPSASRTAFAGSIPAHAGEPFRRTSAPPAAWVYPRPRGGTQIGAARRAGVSGLSPPTRGNQGRSDTASRRFRSIPAHAGEPAAVRIEDRLRGVYPRPRGGTAPRRERSQSLTGLSPPTRGNRSIQCINYT